MKVLVIGDRGQLGRELTRQAIGLEMECRGCDLAEIDITDRDSVVRVVNNPGVSIVINAAAYTAVDKAESEPEAAFAVNRDGAAHLAETCRKAGLPLIQVSTDYVFNGKKKAPYLETDQMAPLGVYGRSKAAGEEAVSSILKEHVTVRTAWLYGVYGHNFVKTILRLARERESISVVDDQFGGPTFASDLAGGLLEIARQIVEGKKEPWGSFHYCGRGKTSWHGFASEIVKEAGAYEQLKVREIKPIPTSEYPTPARRPAYSVLDCSRLKATFGLEPPFWKDSLAEMLKRLYKGDCS